MPATAASQNMSGTRGQRWDTEFLSFEGINILTNQYWEVTLCSRRLWLRKEIVGKVKQNPVFFFLWYQTKEWKSRKGAEKWNRKTALCSRKITNLKTWEHERLAATNFHPKLEGKVFKEERGVCVVGEGRLLAWDWPLPTRVEMFLHSSAAFERVSAHSGRSSSSSCLHSCDFN